MNVYCLPESFCLAGLALCLDPLCLDEGKDGGPTLGSGVSKALYPDPRAQTPPQGQSSLSLATERQLCRRVMGSHARVLACTGPGWVSPWTYTLVPD